MADTDTTARRSSRSAGEDAQREVIAFLGSPAAHGGTAPEHVETHLSHVFLAADRVVKLKKAIRWAMVDYATPERREHFCHKEVSRNARFAASLYRGVRAVTRGPAGLALDGEGEAVDFVVEMRRFPARDQLDAIVENGRLGPDLLDATADAIAELHGNADVVRVADHPARVRHLVGQLGHDLITGLTETPPRADVALWANEATELCLSHARRLDRRGRHGFVRLCHGDLHLSNICLWQGRPTPFDAIEFSDEVATTDVLYDLAFVLVDLEHRGHAAEAGRLLSRYLEATRDYSGLALLPLFRSLRSMVRALTRVAKHRDPAPYIAAAQGAIEARPAPQLCAVGGLSGTGKTTVARLVAARMGAVVIRSDSVRKHLAGRRPEEPLPAAAYTQDASAAVYRRMLVDARRALRAGSPVILDATFLEEHARRAAGAVAQTLGVPFTGAFLHAPLETLLDRVGARHGDASDADAAVVRSQASRDPGALDWQSVDAAGTPEDAADVIAGAARAAIRARRAD